MLEALNSERYRKLVGLIHHWRSDPPLHRVPPIRPQRDQRRRSRRRGRRRANGSPRPSRRGRPESLPTSCSIARARRPSATAMRWRLRSRYGEQGRQDRCGAEGPTRPAREIIRMASSAQPSSVSWAPGIGIRSGQNGFSYGVLYAREAAAGDALLDELKPFL